MQALATQVPQAGQASTGYSNQFYSQNPYYPTPPGGVFNPGQTNFINNPQNVGYQVPGNQQNTYVMFALLSLIIRLVQQLQSVQQQLPKPEALSLDQTQKDNIKQAFSLTADQTFTVLDNDGNGRLSAGDVLTVTGGPLGTISKDLALTAEQVAALLIVPTETPTYLDLSSDLQTAIKQRYTLADGQQFAVVDSDKNGQLNSGDILRVLVGDQVQDFILNEAEIAAIQNLTPAQTQFLNLDQQSQLLIQQRFNLAQGQNFAVIDKDASGTLTVGDTLRAVVNGQIQDTTLSAADITALTATSTSQAQFLTLNEQTQLLIQQRFNLAQGQQFAVVDQDSNNALSIGDVLKVVVNGQVQDLTLTAEDITALNSTAEQFSYLNLNDATQLIVKQLFNIGNQAFAIADKDGSNTVTAGDILRVAVGNNVQDTVLTAEQATAINNNTQQSAFVTLTAAQQTAIQAQFNIQNGQSFGIIDSDNNQTVSAGDILRVIVNGQAQDTVITEIDLAKLNPSTSDNKTLLLTNNQKWTTADDKNYTFVLTRTGEEPVKVTVTNGTVTGASFVSATATGAVPDASKVSIDDLFNLVAAAVNANVVDLSVGYDATKGFPFSIFLDPNTNVVGDEVFLGVSEYTATT